MLRHGIRVGVAILTFTLGVAIFWPLRIIQRLETALVDRFYDISDRDLRPVSLSDDYTVETNEIYRFIIQNKFAHHERVIVLRSETIRYSPYIDDALKPEWAFPQAFNKKVKDSMPEVEFETLSNYQLRNLNGESLKVWDLGVNYVLANYKDLLDDGMNTYWTSFHEQFPNSAGLLSFSAVGFNKERNQAFVYVDWNCRDTCGLGEYILLKKVRGKWEIVKEDARWMS